MREEQDMDTTKRTVLKPVSYKVLPWEGRVTDGMASRTKLRRHRGPY